MRSGFLLSIFVVGLLSVTAADAALVEMSLMGSYGRARLSDGFQSTQRRYTASLEFKFTPVSGIQFEYTDSRTSASYDTRVGVLFPLTKETVTYRDKVYSFNLVQNLVPAKWLIQPYIKVGGGRMDRVYTREIPEFGVRDVISQKVTTGVGGVGLRIFLLRNLAIKGEFNSYVPDFQFSRWKENQLFSTGVSWLF